MASTRPHSQACAQDSRVAREAGDTRPPFAIVADCVTDLGVTLPRRTADLASIQQARDDWLRRLRSTRRSKSSLVAYRVALDDLLAFLERAARPRPVQRADDRRPPRRLPRTPPSRTRHLLPALHPPAALLPLAQPPGRRARPLPRPTDATEAAAGGGLADAGGVPTPPRRRRRRRSATAAASPSAISSSSSRSSSPASAAPNSWRSTGATSNSTGDRPSLLVRSGKGGRPRRQPLPSSLARTLAAIRAGAPADAPVFRGLAGGRLQSTILANIIRRATMAAGVEKNVTAHTLRHTAATWLRQQTGDARLVAAYLGHADLSTVGRYAHVAVDELHAAAQVIAKSAVVAPDVTA